MGFDPPSGGGELGLDCWGLVVEGFLSLEGTFSVLSPSQASPSLPRGERIGFGSASVLGLVGRISGRNHFVVGGVWLLYPP